MIVITLARKPISKGSVVDNVSGYGTGSINIDACRIPAGEDYKDAGTRFKATGMAYMGSHQTRPWAEALEAAGLPIKDSKAHKLGRWPANLILNPVGAEELDRQSGFLHGSGNKDGKRYRQGSFSMVYNLVHQGGGEHSYPQSGGYPSRFFKQVKE